MKSKIVKIITICAILFNWVFNNITFWWNDVIQNDQEFKNALDWMYTNWLTKFSSIESYKAYDQVTREQAAKLFIWFMWAQKMDPIVNSNLCEFDDLMYSDYELSEYIPVACKVWIMVGKNRNFRPTDKLTKAEAFTILIRIINWNQNENISPWWKNYHKKAIELWLTKDNYGNTFNNTINRYEIWLILYRAKNINTWNQSSSNANSSSSQSNSQVTNNNTNVTASDLSNLLGWISLDENTSSSSSTSSISSSLSNTSSNWNDLESTLNSLIWNITDNEGNIVTPLNEMDIKIEDLLSWIEITDSDKYKDLSNKYSTKKETFIQNVINWNYNWYTERNNKLTNYLGFSTTLIKWVENYLLVTKVVPKDIWEIFGIKWWDKIMKINDTIINMDYTSNFKIWDTIKLEIKRWDKTIVINDYPVIWAPIKTVTLLDMVHPENNNIQIQATFTYNWSWIDGKEWLTFKYINKSSSTQSIRYDEMINVCFKNYSDTWSDSVNWLTDKSDSCYWYITDNWKNYFRLENTYKDNEDKYAFNPSDNFKETIKNKINTYLNEVPSYEIKNEIQQHKINIRPMEEYVIDFDKGINMLWIWFDYTYLKIYNKRFFDHRGNGKEYYRGWIKLYSNYLMKQWEPLK